MHLNTFACGRILGHDCGSTWEERYNEKVKAFMNDGKKTSEASSGSTVCKTRKINVTIAPWLL